MSWYEDTRAKMLQHNANQINNCCKYQSLSVYIEQEIIPMFSIDKCGYEISRMDWFVWITTNSEVYKIQRDRIDAYTENGNDCICLTINKHCYKFIDLKTISALEYEEGIDKYI